jgi:hypothetical protein
LRLVACMHRCVQHAIILAFEPTDMPSTMTACVAEFGP